MRSGFRQGTLPRQAKGGTFGDSFVVNRQKFSRISRQCRENARAHRAIAGAPRRGRLGRIGKVARTPCRPRQTSSPRAGDEPCLLYTSDAADEEDSVDLGGRRIIKKKKN